MDTKTIVRRVLAGAAALGAALVLETAGAGAYDGGYYGPGSPVPVFEDSALWHCGVMGNLECGPGQAPDPWYAV